MQEEIADASDATGTNEPSGTTMARVTFHVAMGTFVAFIVISALLVL